MVKLVAEETKAEERERIREEIARLELEGKELAKKIVESERNRNKLAKKRHKIETRTDDSLF